MESLPLQSVGQLEQLFICSGSLVEYLDFSHSFNKYSLKTRTILSDGYTLGHKTKIQGHWRIVILSGGREDNHQDHRKEHFDEQ